MTDKSRRPAIARIWRGRTRPDQADAYEAYNYEVGVRPLIEKALGVQALRENRGDETVFMTSPIGRAWRRWRASPAATPRRFTICRATPSS